MNRSAKPAAIYWLDYAGNASFQLWLRAGGSKEHHSFVGQHWCVVDPDRAEAAQSFIITEPEQTITIR